MSDDEFCDLRDVIYEYCGLFFEPDKKYLLEKRLSRRVSELQLETFRDYALYLRYDIKRDEEMAKVADNLTTNETYFFRENYQLKAFSEEIITEIAARKREKVLRIWSAGCSTGEEPYSIAMLVLEMRKKGLLKGWQVDILGSDISHRVLGVARKGVYGKASFRGVDEQWMKYFIDEGDRKRLADEPKSMVTFSHVNLLDPMKVELLGRMDVIFCRNVIIYFDTKAKKRVMETFYGMLDDEGYLMLGHSESLMNITTQFTLKHFKNDMVYQKPLRHAVKEPAL